MDDNQEQRRKRPLVLAGLAAVVAVVLGGLFVLSPSGAADLATVRPLEPVVRLQQPKHNVFRPVTSAVATNEGAKVETDGTGMAEISFFDGSISRLGPNTDYELSTLDDRADRAIVGDLDVGRTYHRVTELTGSGDRFEVRTPNAVAAVRGTRFIVVCLPNGECTFGVIDGIVEITSRHDGDLCVLRPGEALSVSPDVDCGALRALDLDDPWVRLNLELDGVDFEELRKRLFGDDALPATDDDPAPDEVDGDGDGVGDGAAFAAGGGVAGGGPGAAGGGGVTSGDQAAGADGAPGDQAGPGDPGGQGTTTTARPGETTTTARPGQGSTTTRPGEGSSTTRPRQTTTTRPGGTTTTRPSGNTGTTRPPGTTSTTQRPNCTTGYPPRPC